MSDLNYDHYNKKHREITYDNIRNFSTYADARSTIGLVLETFDFNLTSLIEANQQRYDSLAKAFDGMGKKIDGIDANISSINEEISKESKKVEKINASIDNIQTNLDNISKSVEKLTDLIRGQAENPKTGLIYRLEHMYSRLFDEKEGVVHKFDRFVTSTKTAGSIGALIIALLGLYFAYLGTQSSVGASGASSSAINAAPATQATGAQPKTTPKSSKPKS